MICLDSDGQRSKVKVTEGRRGGEGTHVDAGLSKSIFYLFLSISCHGRIWQGRAIWYELIASIQV